MSVVVTVTINAVAVPLELGDEALAAISTATQAPTEPTWPEWMSVETASRYLDTTPGSLRKLVARRKIPFHQEGKGCRLSFSRPDLDEWMATQRVQQGGDA